MICVAKHTKMHKTVNSRRKTTTTVKDPPKKSKQGTNHHSTSRGTGGKAVTPGQTSYPGNLDQAPISRLAKLIIPVPAGAKRRINLPTGVPRTER